ncbi:hypothetical protein MT325_m068L [Paramecium bursaria chlorella virus MT325]|uniref:Uncharacterized protein m068L n=1 Tax=Paramecium bursaria Chlorella virus MT325 TaxID=346932 RepID=A7ITE8_PBCVM|nr:hypothetical protein MT325_m068L [Paramecium bursaria chlorella virus MT325]
MWSDICDIRTEDPYIFCDVTISLFFDETSIYIYIDKITKHEVLHISHLGGSTKPKPHDIIYIVARRSKMYRGGSRWNRSNAAWSGRLSPEITYSHRRVDIIRQRIYISVCEKTCRSCSVQCEIREICTSDCANRGIVPRNLYCCAYIKISCCAILSK